MKMIPGRTAATLVFFAALAACTPHKNPSPVQGAILSSRILSIDAGGDPHHPTTLPVLAVHLSIANPGAEVRLLGYRYESSGGLVSEALMDRRLVEESRSKLGRLVRLGLPTVFPAGSTTPGWVFFRTNDTKGWIHLSLRDVYGRFASLDLSLAKASAPPPAAGVKTSPGTGTP
ncbi:MAG: hypothetical protein ACYDBP_03055 [Leptospirales bacterium]